MRDGSLVTDMEAESTSHAHCNSGSRCGGRLAPVPPPTCEAHHPAVERPEPLRMAACGQAAAGPHRERAGQVQQPGAEHGCTARCS